MGCSHCLNNATKDGEHMTFETFKQSMEFIIQHKVLATIITGGEPTEHPEFVEFMKYAVSTIKSDPRCRITPRVLMVATNGVWMQSHEREVGEILDMQSDDCVIRFQVSTDRRFYPTRIDVAHPVFVGKYRDSIVVCDDCVEAVYPQGRAKTYKDPNYTFTASKCFNIRAVTKQLLMRDSKTDLSGILFMLGSRGKLCTPAIHYDGGIGLGESDVCPTIATISSSDKEILNAILSFSCDGCSPLNDNLPPAYRALIQESGGVI